MKRKSFDKSNFTANFRNEKLEDGKLNFLRGGDGDGSQGATDPWKP